MYKSNFVSGVCARICRAMAETKAEIDEEVVDGGAKASTPYQEVCAGA
jgi:hypothetical protein